jgi:antagonist of KipI
VLEVIEPGLLSTVQDTGRPGWAHLGVPHAGACDPLSLAVANLLLGNEPGAAALEMTIAGATLAIRRTGLVALAGADLGGVVHETGQRLQPGAVHLLRAGMTIAFPGIASDLPGCRAYLALPGGIDVREVLGSRSTSLIGSFGGIGGRPLAPGDRLRPTRTADAGLAGRHWPGPTGPPMPPEPAMSPVVIRVVDGPDLARLPGGAVDALAGAEWRASVRSDRMGIHLEGPALPVSTGELVSRGVAWGAIQVPPDGAPIVLLADHQTVGGYPVPAVVVSADRPLLGQLRPGDRLRFSRVTLAEARAALHEQRERLRGSARALGAGDPWHDQWRSAAG